MVKKYRLIPEKEYNMWKEHVEKSELVKVDNILDSKLPDDVKIKLFQDQKRIECNERDKSDMTLKMSGFVPPKVVKDVEIQHETKESVCEVQTEPETIITSSIPTPPPPPPTPLKDATVISRKRKDPPIDRTDEFEKQSMRKVARFLSECGIRGNEKGQVSINNKILPDADYLSLIRQLSDARCKRSDSTNTVINELQKFKIPTGVFSPSIMNILCKKSMHVSNDKIESVKWDTF